MLKWRRAFYPKNGGLTFVACRRDWLPLFDCRLPPNFLTVFFLLNMRKLGQNKGGSLFLLSALFINYYDPTKEALNLWHERGKCWRIVQKWVYGPGRVWCWRAGRKSTKSSPAINHFTETVSQNYPIQNLSFKLLIFEESRWLW